MHWLGCRQTWIIERYRLPTCRLIDWLIVNSGYRRVSNGLPHLLKMSMQTSRNWENSNLVIMSSSITKWKVSVLSGEKSKFIWILHIFCLLTHILFMTQAWCSRWFCTPPILRRCIALFAVAKGGCCSISDDLSCSWIQLSRFWTD